jgi:hypothetical protein
MPTDLTIEGYLIAEGATSTDALDVKNALEAQVIANQLGSVVGGGCELSFPRFDLQVKAEDPQHLEDFLRTLLKDKNLADCLELNFTAD